jgi:polyphosphate kinase
MEHAKRGSFAHLIFKVNSLVDHDMIALLYEASQAGVHIDLLVRGMCSLRPGVSGLSEKITVTSIVGRYLEHSRIFFFRNGGHEEIYLGSADLMERNLNDRVELLFPLEDLEHIQRLRDTLDVYLHDNQLAYRMRPDGNYERKRASADEWALNVQDWLMRRRRKSKKQSK